MAEVTVKQLNKILADKGLLNYRVFKDIEYELRKIPYYAKDAVVFSSRDILTVRDYIQDME